MFTSEPPRGSAGRSLGFRVLGRGPPFEEHLLAKHVWEPSRLLGWPGQSELPGEPWNLFFFVGAIALCGARRSTSGSLSRQGVGQRLHTFQRSGHISASADMSIVSAGRPRHLAIARSTHDILFAFCYECMWQVTCWPGAACIPHNSSHVSRMHSERQGTTCGRFGFVWLCVNRNTLR